MFEEEDRNEGEDVVLGSADFVAAEPLWLLSIEKDNPCPRGCLVHPTFRRRRRPAIFRVSCNPVSIMVKSEGNETTYLTVGHFRCQGQLRFSYE